MSAPSSALTAPPTATSTKDLSQQQREEYVGGVAQPPSIANKSKRRIP